MKKIFTLSAFTFLILNFSTAQCDFRTEAIASGDTLHGTVGDLHKSALAFHPGTGYYYSNNAGGSTACEVFDQNGNSILTETPTDWRGLWYNPNTENIEGNTWGNGFVVDSLQSDGNFDGNLDWVGQITAPDDQAPGVYDPTLNIIYFYVAEELYSFDRTDLSPIDTIPLTGLATINEITSSILIYTGCVGNEIGIFHTNSKVLHLFNKSTGALTQSINFPENATVPSYHARHFAFTNDLVWMFSSNTNKWIAYDIFDNSADISNEIKINQFQVFPNPATDRLDIKSSKQTTAVIMSANGTIQATVEINNDSTINVSTYSPGVYFIRTSEGQTLKFIKE